MLREPPQDGATAARRMRPAAHDYLETLNPEQRRAVEHGQDGALLIVAGAGSGKTNTLAYRVAHLVCRGADPRRILLLTFSRRAAVEMERRAGRILQRVLGGSRVPALPWSGTFHGVGARFLREYAPRIGLSESFTIQDRGDSEDLLAVVRHELGLGAAKTRFPGSVVNCSAVKEVRGRRRPPAPVWKHTRR